MSPIAFHFGTSDKLAYCCRLLRKAVGSGARLVVVANADVCQRVDQALWALTPTDFIPHCHATAEQSVVNASPIVLHTSVPMEGRGRVLVNLMASVPQGFEQFARVIEFVSLDEEDRQAARMRWMHYKNLGCPITRHDVAQQGDRV